MAGDYYKYIGDEEGGPLERAVYKVVRREPDHVVLRQKRGEDVRVLKDVWDHYQDMGLLKERDRF